MATKKNACKRSDTPIEQKSADEAVEELGCLMGGYVPPALEHIRKFNSELARSVRLIDRVMVEDGALDKKTKRLIALACVATRMCEDCVYPQAKVAKNFGATREEIVEALHVAVVTGGVPVWSLSKKGISKLFEEWDLEDGKKEENLTKGYRKK